MPCTELTQRGKGFCELKKKKKIKAHLERKMLASRDEATFDSAD